MRIVFKLAPIMIVAPLLAGCLSQPGAYVAKAAPASVSPPRQGPFTRDLDACKAFNRPAYSARSDVFSSTLSGDCVTQ